MCKAASRLPVPRMNQPEDRGHKNMKSRHRDHTRPQRGQITVEGPNYSVGAPRSETKRQQHRGGGLGGWRPTSSSLPLGFVAEGDLRGKQSRGGKRQTGETHPRQISVRAPTAKEEKLRGNILSRALCRRRSLLSPRAHTSAPPRRSTTSSSVTRLASACFFLLNPQIECKTPRRENPKTLSGAWTLVCCYKHLGNRRSGGCLGFLFNCR